jgi:hypothetical protein
MIVCLVGKMFSAFEGIPSSNCKNLKGFNAFVDIQDATKHIGDFEAERARGKVLSLWSKFLNVCDLGIVLDVRYRIKDPFRSVRRRDCETMHGRRISSYVDDQILRYIPSFVIISVLNDCGAIIDSEGKCEWL